MQILKYFNILCFIDDKMEIKIFGKKYEVKNIKIALPEFSIKDKDYKISFIGEKGKTLLSFSLLFFLHKYPDSSLCYTNLSVLNGNYIISNENFSFLQNEIKIWYDGITFAEIPKEETIKKIDRKMKKMEIAL